MGKRIAFLSAYIFSGIILVSVVAVTLAYALTSSTPVPAHDGAPILAQGDAVPACDFPDLVGKSINEIDLAAFGARKVRVLRPNDVATMDFSPERLNINLDANDKVASVTCG